MQDFKGRVAIVTGAASGIGAALAERLSEEGANVVAVDRDSPDATVAKVTANGVQGMGAQVDVSSRASMEALAARVYERFGRADLLCNNAGVVLFSALLDTTDQDWDWMLSVNVKGVINGVSAFVPRMISQGGEPTHVVNTASGAGLIATGPLPTGAYAASKFAVVGYSESLRAELAPFGIGVSILCPGSVHTAILDTARYTGSATQWKPARTGAPTPTREHVRRMEPKDVANLVLAGIRENALYIVTHPEMKAALEARLNAQLAACDTAARALAL